VKNRIERIALIREILSREMISNQDELQLALKELGCEVTQATLSRDLKSMQVIKVNEGKGYVYRLSANVLSSPVENVKTGGNFLSNTVHSIEFSANLGVVKTLPGYANSIAILIDKSNKAEILGTVAGDDTILLIVREGIPHHQVVRVLNELLPGLDYKI
jgi:transcriptional regulator of arginine metabolism